MNSLCLFFIVVITTWQSDDIEGSGILEIELIQYVNPDHTSIDGVCCFASDASTCRYDCHNRFTLCISSGAHASTCMYGGKIESYFIPQDDFFFPSKLSASVTNPVKVTFQRWGSDLQLRVNVDAKYSDKISLVVAFKQDLTTASSAHNNAVVKTYHLKAGDFFDEKELRFSIRVACDEWYLPPDCVSKCIPRDDYMGHYTCDNLKGKLCLPGWTDISSNCTVCNSSKCNETSSIMDLYTSRGFASARTPKISLSYIDTVTHSKRQSSKMTVVGNTTRHFGRTIATGLSSSSRNDTTSTLLTAKQGSSTTEAATILTTTFFYSSKRSSPNTVTAASQNSGTVSKSSTMIREDFSTTNTAAKMKTTMHDSSRTSRINAAITPTTTVSLHQSSIGLSPSIAAKTADTHSSIFVKQRLSSLATFKKYTTKITYPYAKSHVSSGDSSIVIATSFPASHVSQRLSLFSTSDIFQTFHTALPPLSTSSFSGIKIQSTLADTFYTAHSKDCSYTRTRSGSRTVFGTSYNQLPSESAESSIIPTISHFVLHSTEKQLNVTRTIKSNSFYFSRECKKKSQYFENQTSAAERGVTMTKYHTTQMSLSMTEYHTVSTTPTKTIASMLMSIKSWNTNITKSTAGLTKMFSRTQLDTILSRLTVNTEFLVSQVRSCRTKLVASSLYINATTKPTDSTRRVNNRTFIYFLLVLLLVFIAVLLVAYIVYRRHRIRQKRAKISSSRYFKSNDSYVKEMKYFYGYPTHNIEDNSKSSKLSADSPAAYIPITEL